MAKNHSIEQTNALNIMKSFAEGKISVYCFWEEYNKNVTLYKMINEDKNLPEKNKPFLYQKINLNKLYHRCEVFRAVKVYFLRRNIELNFYNDDSSLYSELLDLVPQYIGIEQELIDIIVKEYNYYERGRDERRKIVKKYIKDNYHYQDYPPKWLQDAKWPIINDKPCKFIKQTGNPDDLSTDEIYYYFLDEANNQEIVVHQYI